MSKVLKSYKQAYKFVQDNGEWSIIVAMSKDSAKQEYKNFYNVSDNQYKKNNTKAFLIKNKKTKVKSAFFDNKIPIEVVVNHVKFPPGVVCDFED